MTLNSAAYAILPSVVRVPKLIRREITACLSARSASLLVGGSSGFLTNATTASQSLRISLANALNLECFSSDPRLQAMAEAGEAGAAFFLATLAILRHGFNEPPALS